MFDQLTEDNDARGESDSDVDQGESPTHNLAKYRHKIEVLNSDLHELIFDGEDDGEDGDGGTDQPAKKHKVKKSAKP